MKKVHAPTVLRHRAARHSNVTIIRLILVLIIGLGLTGAIIAERKWSQSRQRSATQASARATRKQSTTRETGLSARGAGQTTWPEDPAILTSTGNSAGIGKELPSSSIVPPSPPTTTRSSSIPRVVEMTIGEDAEQSGGNSALQRSDRIQYSSAVANSGER